MRCLAEDDSRNAGILDSKALETKLVTLTIKLINSWFLNPCGDSIRLRRSLRRRSIVQSLSGNKWSLIRHPFA